MSGEFRPLLALALHEEARAASVGADPPNQASAREGPSGNGVEDEVKKITENGIPKQALYFGGGFLGMGSLVAVVLLVMSLSSSESSPPPPPSFSYKVTTSAFISSSVDSFQTAAYDSSLSAIASPDTISTAVSGASVFAQTTMQYLELSNASSAYSLLKDMSIIDLSITLGVSILSFDVVALGFTYTEPSCTEFPGSACTLAFECGQGGAIDRCSVAGGCGSTLNQVGMVTTSCGPLTY